MAFAIKAGIQDSRAKAFAFTAQKTMYGGKHVSAGDIIFVFASENEGGQGLIARGIVTSATAVAKKRGIARQTPRVTLPSSGWRWPGGHWGAGNSKPSATGRTAGPRPN